MSGPNITILNFDDGGHAFTLPSSRLTSYDVRTFVLSHIRALIPRTTTSSTLS
jgi:hypothetical protein